MNKPTDEMLHQLRVRIAELCGWTKKREIEPGYWVWIHPVAKEPWGQAGIPDYCHDLNAIHEVEKTLSNGQMGKYLQILAVEVLPKKPTGNLRDILPMHAEAWQRAVAMDRTLIEKPVV